MVDVPVYDENPLQTVFLTRVVRGEGNVSKKAESHRPIVDGVVARRTHRGEAARMHAADREIDRGKHTASARRRCFPRTSTLHGICIEASAALLGKHSHGAHVGGVVHQLELFHGGVTTFDVLDTVEQLRIFTQRAGDGAQTADVLGMSPTRVVTAAIAM